MYFLFPGIVGIRFELLNFDLRSVQAWARGICSESYNDSTSNSRIPD